MPNLQEIIKLIESKKKHSFPWQPQTAYAQPYFTYSADTKSWQPAQGWSLTTPQSTTTTTFRILSWNIDFMLPYTNERMQIAVDHIQRLISASSAPSIVFLNEMLVSDLKLMQAQGWIQEGYNMTDVDDKFWESGHYGTCTLIPKSLAVTNVFRVHYEATHMERDGLFVDVDLGQGKAVTVCNTHLESLVADPPLRPKQVETAAKYLHNPHLIGGVMGGDFNAIQPFDRTLHSDNGLKDAYLELGGTEDSEHGYTWGQMAPVKQREMFGCSRMDKLFFCGSLEVVDFQRFGYGVHVKDDKIRQALMNEEGLDGGWVTDHLGVMATFNVVDVAEARSAPKI